MVPFDPFAPQPKMSYKDGYQKRYFVLDSFQVGGCGATKSGSRRCSICNASYSTANMLGQRPAGLVFPRCGTAVLIPCVKCVV